MAKLQAMTDVAPILIVDDEPECIEIAERLVRTAGVSNPVVICTSGEAAIEYLGQCIGDAGTASALEPALVLLDVRMPGMDGLAVLEWMRRQPALTRTRIIMWSASASGRQVDAALRGGADAFFTKFPVPAVAGAAIRAALRVHAASVGAHSRSGHPAAE